MSRALRIRTLWELVDSDRIAVPLAVASVVWTTVVIVAISTGVLSLVMLEAVASSREHAADVDRRRALSEFAWSDPELGDEQTRALLDSIDARVAEIDARAAEPLPATGIVAGTLALVLVGCSPLLLMDDRMLIVRLRARPASHGEHSKTTSALVQASLAAGLPYPPDLLIVESASVNALSVRRRDHAGFALCVTRGVTMLPRAEQEAIIANLVARSIARRSAWLTRVAPLVSIGWLFMRAWEGIGRLIERGPEESSDMPSAWTGGILSFAFVFATFSAFQYLDMLDGGHLRGGALSLGTLLPAYLIALVTLPPVAAGVTLAQARDAELGDSEGLLLTKDPAGLLAAMKTMSEHDTYLPVPNAYGHLCWAWPGGRATFGAWSMDHRLRRIRAVAGAAGIDRSQMC